MLPVPLLQQLVLRALEEDLASGDLTTEATIDPEARCAARAVAKTELVVCGFALFEACFRALDPECRVSTHVREGEKLAAGALLFSVEGRSRALLQAERSALNFTQRMSGISTLTRRYVEALPAGCKTRIADTRKTTPGLRALERYAVRTGGGHNHRDNLGSAVMIKDNHIVAAGGLTRAVQSARAYAPHTTRIEVEVDSFALLDEALSAGADIIMLDNFAPEQIERAVKQIAGRAIVEVSGGITLARIPELARAGVDVISVGALTHSAPAADISLQF